jgi:hypothetical protein
LKNQQLGEWFGCIHDPRNPQPIAPKKFALIRRWLADQPAAKVSRTRLLEIADAPVREV